MKLRVALLLGTARVPPPPVLGPRVAAFIREAASRRGFEVDTVDPLVEQLPLLEKPQFAYAKSAVPPNLASLQERLAAADCYCCVTPEYNHAPSPALLNMLNHFGSSLFGFKPSLIVSYSGGQWGGTRAAHALRPALSELGCIPVSAMIHVPKAGEAFSADGTPASDAERWHKYADRGLSQLQWWAEAAKAQRLVQDPYEASPAFRTDPSQRNAPS